MSQIILSIDPGPVQSAWVLLDGDTIIDMRIQHNEVAIDACSKPHAAGFMFDEDNPPSHLAIEMIASYGMPVGKSVFETCVWIGRFIERWDGPYTKVYRGEVKMNLCNSMRAKDSNISQAIRDRYPATGGGKTPQVGTKAQPGPLYGVKKDIWAALAVGLTWYDMQDKTT